MNFRVMPAWLLPLNRPRNGIPPCLKEGGVWERGDKQCPFFPSLFICSRRDQSGATVCSRIRARRIRNLCCVIYPYPALCCRYGVANGDGGAVQTPWAPQMGTRGDDWCLVQFTAAQKVVNKEINRQRAFCMAWKGFLSDSHSL